MGIVVVDDRGTVQVLNRWFEEFADLDRAACSDRLLLECWPPALDIDMVGPLDQLFVGHGPEARVGSFDRDGNPCHVRMHYRRLQSDTGARAMILVEDVTEQQRAIEERDRLFATMSHDLRAPVAAIANFAEVLVDEHQVQGPLQSDLAEIARTCRELVAVVEDTNRRMAGAAPPHVRVDLAEIMVQVVRQFRHHSVASKRDVRLFGGSVDRCSGPEAPLETNPASAARALRNLLDNALRYSQLRVSLDIQREGEGWLLTIDDDGQGVPEGHELRIFEKGVQGPDALPGTGLGLHQVWRWVHDNDGSITVGRSPLGGARFELRLPAR